MILRVLLQIEVMYQVSADSWRITLEYRVYTIKKASDVPGKRLFLVHHYFVIWKNQFLLVLRSHLREEENILDGRGVGHEHCQTVDSHTES